jgi:RNA polymerase primary sigma factor
MGRPCKTETDECISRYFEDIKDSKPLTYNEEAKLARKIQKGDNKAAEKLVFANLKFVISIAKNFQGNGVDLVDLINDGNEGLVIAAKKFDPDRGYKFISFAIWWVRESILRGLHQHARTIKLPVNIINELARVKKHLEKFELANERQAIKGDVLFKSKKKTIEYKGDIHPHISSLNHVINEEGEEMLDLIAGVQERSPDHIESNDLKISYELNKALGYLTRRERKIIELYFGLNEGYRNTLDVIGELLNISKERVRQIKVHAIRKMRTKMLGTFELL